MPTFTYTFSICTVVLCISYNVHVIRSTLYRGAYDMCMHMSVIPVHVTLTHKLHMHILHGTSLEPKQMHLNL